MTRYYALVFLLIMLLSCKKEMDHEPAISANFFFECHSAPDYPMSVDLIAEVKDADEYLWELPDGTEGSGARFQWQAQASGHARVRLKVRKGNVENSFFRDIEVPYRQQSVVFTYVIPKDGIYNAELLEGLKSLAVEIQQWYAKQTGGKTFRLNNPVVDTLISTRLASTIYPSFVYLRDDVWDRLQRRAKRFEQVVLAFLPIPDQGNAYGFGTHAPDGKHFAVVFNSSIKTIYSFGDSPYGNPGGNPGGFTPTHELGHTFGLPHSNDRHSVMFAAETGPPYIHDERLFFPDCYLTDTEKEKMRNSPFFF